MFGSKHLIGLLVCFLASIVFLTLTLVFIKKDIAKKWILRGLAILLLVLEFMKYVFALKYNGGVSISTFPLQLCSIPLLVFPLAAFSASPKAKIWGQATSLFCILPALLALVYPSNILNESIKWSDNGFFNLPVISFFYHTIMLVFPLFMVISKQYQVKGWDFIKSGIILTSFAIVAIIMNYVLDADFMLLGKGTGLPGPFYEIFKINKVLYIVFMVFLGNLINFLLFLYWFIKDIRKQKRERATS